MAKSGQGERRPEVRLRRYGVVGGGGRGRKAGFGSPHSFNTPLLSAHCVDALPLRGKMNHVAEEESRGAQEEFGSTEGLTMQWEGRVGRKTSGRKGRLSQSMESAVRSCWV